jgi:hypothetical protein
MLQSECSSEAQTPKAEVVIRYVLLSMKTTINLPDRILAQAKKAARDSHLTLAEFIVGAVRESLARRQSKPLPVYPPPGKTAGLNPGVDLDDSAALLDLMEPPDTIARRFRK